MMRTGMLALTCSSILLAACEGEAGPMGPAGPVGPGGPGTRVVLTTVVSSNGTASVALPAAAGTLANPPGLTCYTGTGTALLVVGTDLDGPLCGLVQSASGGLTANLDGAVPGWTARFVVVY
ncbi:MAG TPA: hypothetical protein VM759_06485 [Longimicrobium sp.]|nr:hypothetical protein [Longimicrobium sp.]